MRRRRRRRRRKVGFMVPTHASEEEEEDGRDHSGDCQGGVSVNPAACYVTRSKH